jgi:hypothetical protein
LTTEASTRRTFPLVRTSETVTIVAMGLMVVAILSVALGPNGLGLAPNLIVDSRVMSVQVDLDFPVDIGDRLTWLETENGTVDAVTGRPFIELAGPTSAVLLIWEPTAAERAVWTL